MHDNLDCGRKNMIIKIEEKEGLELYKKYMETDFPEDERPSYKEYKKLTISNKHEIYKYQENGETVAYFRSREKDNNILITHLAVIKKYRGIGIGKRLLNSIINFYKNKNLLIVEAESEKMANNEAELDIIKKRKKYYLNAGFEEQKGVKYILTDVDYSILVYYYITKLTNLELTNIIKSIYNDVLPNMDYLKIESDEKDI